MSIFDSESEDDTIPQTGEEEMVFIKKRNYDF